MVFPSPRPRGITALRFIAIVLSVSPNLLPRMPDVCIFRKEVVC